MARAGPDGSWICPWCERMLPESDFQPGRIQEAA